MGSFCLCWNIELETNLMICLSSCKILIFFPTCFLNRWWVGFSDHRGGWILTGNLCFRIFSWKRMASVSIVPASGLKNASGSSISVDKLPDEMNDMKIRDDKAGQVFFSHLCPYLPLISLIPIRQLSCSSTFHVFIIGNGSSLCWWEWHRDGPYHRDDYWWQEWSTKAGTVNPDGPCHCDNFELFVPQ